MTYFAHIFFNNIIPLFVLIGAGIVLQRCFHLDIKTLSKLNFYLFSPAVIFTMLYESKISGAMIGQVVLFYVLFFVSLIIVTELVMRMRGYQKGFKVAFRHSVLFYNCANYSIPLNQLVFQQNPLALSIQVIVATIQTIMPYTYGVYSINAHRQSLGKTLKNVFSLPVIYSIPLALICKGLSIEVPQAMYTPLSYIADGFIATALVTLGAQLGTMKWKFQFSEVLISNTLRLLVSPLIGFCVVYVLGLEGILAQALILSCAVPSALNGVLLAVEFDNEPEFASQTVVSSTVFSIITVMIVIYLLKI